MRRYRTSEAASPASGTGPQQTGPPSLSHRELCTASQHGSGLMPQVTQILNLQAEAHFPGHATVLASKHMLSRPQGSALPAMLCRSFTVQCGSGHYKRLMEQYPRVTEVFLTLKPEYQKVPCPSCTLPCVTAKHCDCRYLGRFGRPLLTKRCAPPRHPPVGPMQRTACLSHVTTCNTLLTCRCCHCAGGWSTLICYSIHHNK